MKRKRGFVFWLAIAVVALVVGGAAVSMYVGAVAANAGQAAGQAGGKAAGSGFIAGVAESLGVSGAVDKVQNVVAGSKTYQTATSWAGRTAEAWDQWWASWFDTAEAS